MIWSLFKTLPAPVAALPEFTKTVTPVIATTKNLVLRNQAYTDVLQTRITWMSAEGWSGVMHGLAPTYALDPNGFYMLERDGVKAASISMVCYPKIKFAYVGFYVVPAELRGQGLGGYIFTETLKHTEQTRGMQTIGLNCLAPMTPLYRKWGFVTHTIDDIWKLKVTSEKTFPIPASKKLTEISKPLLEQIINYDAAVFGTTRREFLTEFINKPNTATVVFEDAGEIKGYGVISVRTPAKPEPHGSFRIGPMYAKNAIIAHELLQRLLTAVELQAEQAVFLETPGTNAAAAPIVTQFGFERIAQMDKMYRGPLPEHADEQIFCYCSLGTGG